MSDILDHLTTCSASNLLEALEFNELKYHEQVSNQIDTSDSQKRVTIIEAEILRRTGYKNKDAVVDVRPTPHEPVVRYRPGKLHRIEYKIIISQMTDKALLEHFKTVAFESAQHESEELRIERATLEEELTKRLDDYYVIREIEELEKQRQEEAFENWLAETKYSASFMQHADLVKRYGDTAYELGYRENSRQRSEYIIYKDELLERLGAPKQQPLSNLTAEQIALEYDQTMKLADSYKNELYKRLGITK